jgi:hypothetical protein
LYNIRSTAGYPDMRRQRRRKYESAGAKVKHPKKQEGSR